ncbi:unnamed protein product [Gongylonema pulchrum]|uniref:Tektin n=1 Tax=Gongylonema pulchrum TaxID=637853 RepID=A0A183DWK6_9BILA|nr:unnamed protein product [Gongylonema pulchrum]
MAVTRVRLEAELEAVRDTTVALLETLKTINIDAKVAKVEEFKERVADSAAKIGESVATIHPSVHEQVTAEDCRSSR